MKKSYTFAELDTQFIDYDLIDLPTWSLSAIVNGDYSGLSEQDEEDVNTFADKMWEKGFNYDRFDLVEITDTGIEIVDDPVEYFCGLPAFGRPCGCFKAFYAY